MKNLSKKTLLVFVCLALAFSLSAKSKKKAAESSTPKSIVALSPAAAEILFAIGAGDQVAAVSEYTDYPEEATKKPVAGGFDGKALSIETILSFKPDFVYLTDGMHNFLIQDLDAFGINWYLSKGTSIDSVKQEILDIGQITGHAKEAKAVVSGMDKKLKQAMKLTKIAPAPVYYEVWNDPYMSAGSTSFINDVIEKAGGRNIFGDIAEGYPVVSEETIIARSPAVILISMWTPVESVTSRAGWESIPAIENGKVINIDDNVYTRPGPRVVDAVLDLASILNK